MSSQLEITEQESHRVTHGGITALTVVERFLARHLKVRPTSVTSGEIIWIPAPKKPFKKPEEGKIGVVMFIHLATGPQRE